MIETDVCIVGGGPAGMVLALLLARRGVHTVVLEKHADFLRDFRGDTVHPSTLDLFDDLGLGGAMQALPHREARNLQAEFVDGVFTLADFSRLRGRHPYVMFVPQWDFLELVAAHAADGKGFTLLRSHAVTELTRAGGTVTGVRATGPDGPVEVRARLTVAADGRNSTVRRQLGLTPIDHAAPMDVLWFRLPRQESDGHDVQMRVGAGRLMITIDRGDYWQIAYVIPKGGYDAVTAAGLPAFRDSVARLAPHLLERTQEIQDWAQVSLLTVTVNRLRRWHAPGVLLIGDAAHAMSPVGGVGINLAIQDAVAAARILSPDGELHLDDLDAIRRRRQFPTVGTQLMQRIVQRALIGRTLSADRPQPAPWPIRLVSRMPAFQLLAARMVGVGLRPEHLQPAS